MSDDEERIFQERQQHFFDWMDDQGRADLERLGLGLMKERDKVRIGYHLYQQKFPFPLEYYRQDQERERPMIEEVFEVESEVDMKKRMLAWRAMAIGLMIGSGIGLLVILWERFVH